MGSALDIGQIILEGIMGTLLTVLNKFDAKSLEGRQVHAKCGKEVF